MENSEKSIKLLKYPIARNIFIHAPKPDVIIAFNKDKRARSK